MKSHHVSPSSARPVYHCTGVVVATGYFYSIQTTYGRYDNVPSVVGRCELKDEVYIQFGDPKNRRHPLIVYKRARIVSEARRRASTIIIVDVISWLQSNKYSDQLPLGGKLPSYCYEPATNTYSHSWSLFTRYDTIDNEDNIEPSFLAYGLGRWQPDAGDDLWISGYPQKDPSDGWGVAIGAYGVSSRSQAWEAGFGSGEGSPVQLDNRSFQFFADALSKCATVLPDQNSTPSRACTAKSESIYAQTDLDKRPWNASLHSFNTSSPTVVKSYLCLPNFESGSDTVDFWTMNQSSLVWSKTASVTASTLPSGGSSEVPTILAHGSDQTEPQAWVDNEVLIFVSGGTQGEFSDTEWDDLNWTVRGLKPDGAMGTRLASKTFTATSTPRVLTNASFRTQALAAPYPLAYEWSGTDVGDSPSNKIFGGVILGPDSNPYYDLFRGVTPLAMPVAGPNMRHLPKIQGLEARMGFSFEKNWPSDDRIRGGNFVVDDEKTAWFVVLEPEPVLYHGSSSSHYPDGLVYVKSETSTGTAALYYWTYFENNQCAGFTTNAHGWNINTTIHPVGGFEVSTNPEDWPGDVISCVDLGYPEGTPGNRTRTWSMEDKGTRNIYPFEFRNTVGYLWNTKLYGLKSNNSLVEIDITQKQDVELSATLGSGPAGGPGSGSTSYTVTEPSVPTPDAVWKWIPFRSNTGRRLMAVLRDLHYERDGDCEPAPVIEIRDLDAAGTVLSTTRLGSQERRDSAFTSESGEFSYLEGDNIWNPYAHGAPRMKCCRDMDGNPVAIVIVGEQKVVDVESDHQFNRVVYHSLRLVDPENPEVVTRTFTSPEVAIGESPGDPVSDEYDPENPESDLFVYALWRDWDTLVPTSGHLTWIRGSKFYELTP